MEDGKLQLDEKTCLISETVKSTLHWRELDDFDILEWREYCFELYNSELEFNKVTTKPLVIAWRVIIPVQWKYKQK